MLNRYFIKAIVKETANLFLRRFLLLLFLAMSGLISAQNSVQHSDTIIDQRDGKSYATIKIGNQYWMAQNLNYGSFDKVSGNCGEVGQKHCYDNNFANCEKLGALYTWYEANNENVCPSGWHIPTKAEWVDLSNFLGEKEAAQKIKASPTDPISWDGTNETGFNAIPSGTGNGEGFARLNDWALYWTSDKSGDQRAWTIRIDGFWYTQPPKYKCFVFDSFYLQTNTLSVRCIQDAE